MPFSLNNTWVTGQVVAASDMNAHANAILALVNNWQTAVVATSESTASTTYTDLTTTTDQVTVTVGQSGVVIVLLQAQLTTTGGTHYAYVGVALSGANTQAASNALGLQYIPWTAGFLHQAGDAFALPGLAPGATTFKMKYAVGNYTGTFANRRITVLALP